MTDKEKEVLVDIQKVSHRFLSASGKSRQALDDVSFNIYRGEIFALVGESGSGKSTLAKILTALIKPDTGRVLFDNIDLTQMSESQLRPLRGRFQLMFQDPLASFNPRHRLQEILDEPLILRGIKDKEQRHLLQNEILEEVGLAHTNLRRYPHQFSGGQRQRLGLARLLLRDPEFLIFDEPTSSLDAPLQEQMIELIRSVKEKRQLSYLIISHDLRMVARLADRVGVIHKGKMIETGSRKQVLDSPEHPYTRLLLAAEKLSPEEFSKHYPDDSIGDDLSRLVK